MFVFDKQMIQTLAASLARHWTSDRPADEGAPGEEALAQALLPGVAAFLCVLTGALPGRDEWLRPIVETYFNGAGAAKAFGRLLTGQETARPALAGEFLKAGMDADALDRGAFDEAVDAFVAAVIESARRGDRLVYLTGGQPAADITPGWMREPVASYIDALLAEGLGGVAEGLMFSANGQTVIFGARIGWSMAEAAGPEEGPEDGAGPDSRDEPTLVGETGSEPPPAPAIMEPEPEPPPAVVDLRLDAALPANVFAGRAFDLIVAIRQLNAAPLAPADLERRESANFGVLWPEDAPSIQLRIQISAPDCDIAGGDSQTIRLLAGKNSPDVIFQLTPRRAGPLSIVVTVFQETDWIGSARLRTEAGGEEAAGGSPRGDMTITVNSQPLGNGEVNLMVLRQALDEGYNESELRDLCFELEIDYEDLGGDSQSARARELVLFAKRRDLLARLVAYVMRDRPHLLVPA
jgi:hypothetical protein